MAIANSQVNYVEELLNLRNVYMLVHPQSRLNVINKRLEQPEIGPTRLVTVISAVEALARSLLIHRKAKTEADLISLYSSAKSKEADSLVVDFLKHCGHQDPALYFTGDTWQLFRHAINFRNLIVHECTYLGQDKYPSLIDAGLEVLSGLVVLGQLRAGRT